MFASWCVGADTIRVLTEKLDNLESFDPEGVAVLRLRRSPVDPNEVVATQRHHGRHYLRIVIWIAQRAGYPFRKVEADNMGVFDTAKSPNFGIKGSHGDLVNTNQPEN